MESDECLLLSFAGGGRRPVGSAALATAEAVLDEVLKSGEVSPEKFPQVVASISFFSMPACACHEVSKMRAFVDLWDEIAETLP
jgi:(2R)-ethylmalonyl-CoA mutase